MNPDALLAGAVVIVALLVVFFVDTYGHERRCVECRASFAVFTYRRCWRHRVRT